MEEPLSLTIHHRGTSHTILVDRAATPTDLAIAVAEQLHIPPENQKYLISPKPGMLKPPFSSTDQLTSLLPAEGAKTKITLLGTSTQEIDALNESINAQKARQAARAAAWSSPAPTTSRRKAGGVATLSSVSYGFDRILPLQGLPHPERSLAFLERLANDPGVKFAMQKHRFRVGLLTEMDPATHTTHESRTLGLNRNKGQVIELRLRTDNYLGYRDYRTIRRTLCHELAHNVHSEHDRQFWELTKQLEREVERADWTRGGRSVGGEEFYNPADWEGYVNAPEGAYVDHGGWTGGEFVLGSGNGSTSSSTDQQSRADEDPSTRREKLAKAAEERLKRMGAGRQ
ncbi:hypothetical protein VTN49DRAFT_842 [Thermomyces lanuginosus]|uniref:uncharacterized protein n=1 Tax=Thermomyces lanuginosus TaxID=5541 RepID=UPI003743D2A7